MIGGSPRTVVRRRAAALPAILAAGLALAPAAPGGPVETLPPEALKPGMEGTARTVFEGDRLEEFKVEILGVLKNAVGPQQDLILGRLHGEKVEFTGVVSGMSGSPVYVGGKLIGAVSYRIGPFGKEAIAGITPIGDMLRVAGPATGETPHGAAVAPDLLGSFLAAAGGRSSPLVNLAEVPAAGVRPIGTPLVCSGCDAGVLAHFAPIFESHGLEPAAGGGSLAGAGVAGPGDAALPLEPGTAIGGALVTGDLSLVGIGTLTHVDGRRVYAFGHPMLGTGPVEIPMTQAQVILTFPSAAASFKIANATRPIGTILADGLTAIMGEVGRTPPAIPVRVKVTTPGGSRSFRYDILRHRSWSPVMLAVVASNSMIRTTEFNAAATLSARLRIDLDGHPGVSADDLYSGINPGQPVHLTLASEAGSLFALLINNRFEDVNVRGVELEVETLPPARLAAVTSLRASPPFVRPGEPFTVTAGLTPYRGETREVAFEVRLPEDTPPGETEIIVGGGSAVEGLDRRTVERQAAQAAGIDDMIRLIGRQKKNDGLYLRVSRRGPSAIVRSEVLPDLPLSIFSVFNNPRLSADATLMLETPILEIEKDLDVVAVGGRRISVRVK